MAASEITRKKSYNRMTEYGKKISDTLDESTGLWLSVAYLLSQ
jgi:hypothetical protein